MEEKKRCPECGKPVETDGLAGLCPGCMMKVGMGSVEGPQAGCETQAARFEPPDVEDLAKHFPQLEIQELVGVGGMGAVYLARQTNLDRLVALKILAPRGKDDPSFIERFTREAKALARLSHPHIVTVYDFGRVEDLCYFIMEYVDGTNLRAIQQAGTLPPREALNIVPQICAALQYAHDHGVVHRDIKPENILLDSEGQVKIADFGLAKVVGQAQANITLTQEGHVMGTPHYMAPEQVEHPRDVDHRADIYSLGVVFYEMLTGELPLGKFKPPSQKVQVDVRLDEVVLKTLAKEPQLRYQQVSQVGTEVEGIVTSNPVIEEKALRKSPLREDTQLEKELPAGGFDFWRLCKRLLLLLTTGFLLLIAGMLVASVVLPWIHRARHEWNQSSLSGNELLESVTDAPFIARLPQGTIELWGVCEHPSKGKQWWAPDGSPMESPAVRNSGKVYPQEGQVGREFLLRMAGLPEGASRPVLRTRPAGSSAGGSVEGADGRHIPDLCMKSVTLPAKARNADVIVGVALGPWETISERAPQSSGMETSVRQGENWAISFMEAVETENETRISVSHTVGSDWQVRVVAQTDAGEQTAGSGDGNSTRGMTHMTFGFGDLALADIKAFKFQVRPFRWAEFRNVSLMRGQKTAVQIKHAAKSMRDAIPTTQASDIRAVQLPKDPFAASVFPQGKIELLAVSGDPCDSDIWWKPDGSPWTEDGFYHQGSQPDRTGETVWAVRQIVFRASGIPEDRDWYVGISNAGVSMMGNASQGLQGEQDPNLWLANAALRSEPSTLDLELGVASGPWKTLACSRPDEAARPSADGFSFSFGKAHEKDGSVELTISHNVQRQQIKIVAIDSEGSEYEPVSFSSGSSNDIVQSVVTFDGPRLADIEVFEFRTRPYHWVEFKDISLEPKHPLFLDKQNFSTAIPDDVNLPSEVEKIFLALNIWLEAAWQRDYVTCQQHVGPNQKEVSRSWVDDLHELQHIDPGWQFSLLSAHWDEMSALVCSKKFMLGYSPVGAPRILLFMLSKQEERWLITDIDLEELEGLQVENSRFLKEHPHARVWLDDPDARAPDR